MGRGESLGHVLSDNDYGTDLPAVPDRATGEPRPPTAPTGDNAGSLHTPIDRAPHRHPLCPPSDQGPVLEWNQTSTWLATKVSCVVALIAVGVVSLIQHGVSWTTTAWPAWIGIAVVTLAMWVSMRREWLAAGAFWVQNRRAWVLHYELTRVEFHEPVLLGWGRSNRPVTLRLTDSNARTVKARLRALQANPKMWDLVYNGILHSVASGRCDISPRAYFKLGLPHGAGVAGTAEQREFPSLALISRIAVLGVLGVGGAVVAAVSIGRHEYRYVALGIGIAVFALAMVAFVVWMYRDATSGTPDRPVDRHPIAAPLAFTAVLMILGAGITPIALQKHAYPIAACGIFIFIFVPFMTLRSMSARRRDNRLAEESSSRTRSAES